MRTNNALVQTFNVNTLNELTTATNSGTLTVAGTTTVPATNVAVNGSAANVYADATFALGGFVITNGDNVFTAIGRDAAGDIDTNSVTVNLPGTNNYVYDLNGNLLGDGTRGFDWNDENELISVTVTNSFKKEYVYDGKQRLRIRKEFGWIGGGWTQTNEIHYIYDGNVIVQLRDTNNLPTLTFTRGNDLSGSLQGAGGMGGLLAMTENSGTNSYYHCDGNGNITCLIDANQLMVGKYAYDPFGRPLSWSGTKASVNPVWYSSQIYDPGTGFLHYLYRIYIPELDRWPNRDPIQEAGGINLYRFVGNNPINWVDPFGLQFAAMFNGWNPYYQPPPPPSLPSFSFGVLDSASVEAGSGAGAGAQLSAGGGFFYSPNDGLSAGGFWSGGAFAGIGDYSVSAVKSPSNCPANKTGPAAGGSSIGVGSGFWLSNAGSPADLGGPFDQWNLNLSLLSISFAQAGDTWMFSATSSGGASYTGGGISGSVYPTSTFISGGINLNTGRPVQYVP